MAPAQFTPGALKARLDPLLADLGRQGEGPLAAGVSGGGDSMALVLAVAEAYPGRVHAFTVDHGLRAASAGEARQVHEWLSARGIAHRVLEWLGEKPPTGIQAAAREARYRLLGEAAIALGAKHGLAAPLLIAHTLEDQAETFALRAVHSSDLAGLGAMRMASELATMPPVPLLRPLLGITRGALRAYLRGLGARFIEDPSNLDQVYERVRLRAAIAELEADGLGVAMLARTSRLMARIDALIARAGVPAAPAIAPEGFALGERRAIAALGEPAGLRLLATTLRVVGGGGYPPGRAALARLWRRLEAPDFSGATLAGCRIAPTRQGRLAIVREFRGVEVAAPLVLAAGNARLWDNRFWIRLPSGAQGGTVRPAGAPLAEGAEGFSSAWANLPRQLAAAVAAALPALQGEDGAIRPIALAGDIADWRRASVPAALFIGAERAARSLASLWRDGAEIARPAQLAPHCGQRVS